MKRTMISLAMILSFISPIFSQTSKTVFSDFYYEGQDNLPSYNAETHYLNPILSGCAPDPAITRKGDDYYLANSSFSYFPGVPIWHSRDLVNWDFVGYALDRPSQLHLDDGVRLSAGVYAPDIKYNPYNDTFYLIVTAIGSGGNIVVKTKDPRKGWSEAIQVDVPGIDPGFLFEPGGKAYIVNNQDPDGPAEYDGHRAIGFREYDLSTDKIVEGSAIQLIEKGVHPEDKPIWCEGPHLYHIGGSYYLMTAEGGTGDWHSEVVYHSDSLRGPYTPCKTNPILTQRTLPKDRVNPITAAGHADLFQTPTGEWWAIFLGILPYEYGQHTYCNTGRSTFMLPARWEVTGKDANGKLLYQPMILEETKTIPYVVEKNNLEANGERKNNTGNVIIKDFAPATGKKAVTNSDEKIDPMWIQVRTPKEKWYKRMSNGVELSNRPISIYEQKNPSYLCRWIKNFNFTSTVAVDFTPKSNNDLSGFAIYQDEKNNYVIGKTMNENGKQVITLQKSDKGKVMTLASVKAKKNKKVYMRIDSKGADINFFYSYDGKTWQQLSGTQDARILSTEYAGGFTGATIGLYATSNKNATSEK